MVGNPLIVSTINRIVNRAIDGVIYGARIGARPALQNLDVGERL